MLGPPKWMWVTWFTLIIAEFVLILVDVCVLKTGNEFTPIDVLVMLNGLGLVLMFLAMLRRTVRS